MDVHGAVAIVTGGGSGLGAAACARLAVAGATVVVVDRDEQAAAAVADGINGAKAVRADVARLSDVEAAVEEASAIGPLRVVVGCAGTGVPPRRLVSGRRPPYDEDAWRLVMEVNLTGTFHLLRAAGEAMSRTEPVDDDGARGVIVTVSSTAALDGAPGVAAYSASKGGVVSLTATAARDLGRHGIRAVCVAPGPFDTPMYNGMPDASKREMDAQHAFPHRAGRPSEFAALVAHIVENDYLNAETIRLDGGLRQIL